MNVLDALRVLTQFDLSRRSIPERPVFDGLDWNALVERAVAEGLAPIVAYTLEYRLGADTAPADARDRLLGYYQGTMDDNVFKLVSAKKLLEGFERPFAIIGGPAWVDAVYPHVAFRPLPETPLMLAREDFFALARHGENLGYRFEGEDGRAALLTDGKHRLHLFDAATLFGAGSERPLFERATPIEVFGPYAARLSSEDQLLASAARIADAGFEVPAIELVDLRELLQGAPNGSLGVWGVPDAAAVRARAQALELEAAFARALRMTSELFPPLADSTARFLPV